MPNPRRGSLTASRAGWVFTPTMAVGAMWDSNVTVRNQGEPADRRNGSAS